MILAQKSSPVPSSRRSSPAPVPRRGCLVLPVPRRSSEPSPAMRSRTEPPPALGRVEQLDLIHRLSIETKFQFQLKRESKVQGPQLILNIQNQPATGVAWTVGISFTIIAVAMSWFSSTIYINRRMPTPRSIPGFRLSIGKLSKSEITGKDHLTSTND